MDEEGEVDMSEAPLSDDESLVSCSKSQRVISQESADEESDASSEDKVIEAPKKESLADIQDSLRESLLKTCGNSTKTPKQSQTMGSCVLNSLMFTSKSFKL